MQTLEMDFCKFRIPIQGGRVIWEITNECNYACSYCIFASTGKKPVGELDTEQIFSTLKALSQKGFTHLKFTGGEPFLRPDMLAILQQANRLGFHSDISTNASFLTPELVEQLALLNLDMIHVSLDGHNENIHEAVRGKKSFAPTLRGIQYLTQSSCYVRVGCVLHAYNEYHISDMIEFCHALGVNEVVFSMMEPVGRMRGKDSSLATSEKVDLIREIESYSSDALKISHNMGDTKAQPSTLCCPAGEQFLFINSLGDVSPCTWISEKKPHYILGNLKLHSLSELLESKIFMRFRQEAQSVAGQCVAHTQAQVLKFSPQSKIYAFATENLAYLYQMNMQDKQVLSVGASYDQALMSFILGAKKVDCFDINEHAKYYADLKRVAAKHLNFDDFQTFFHHTSKAFKQRIFEQLRFYLPPDSEQFFASLYHTYKTGEQLRTGHIFNTSFDTPEKKIFNVPYLSSPMLYHKLKDKNLSGQWFYSDLNGLSKNLNQSYDIILLSNIADYSHKMFLSNHTEEFKKQCVEPLLASLNSGGSIMFAYIFDYDNIYHSHERNIINNAKHSQTLYNIEGFEYKEILIPSSLDNSTIDCACILRKIS